MPKMGFETNSLIALRNIFGCHYQQHIWRSSFVMLWKNLEPYTLVYAVKHHTQRIVRTEDAIASVSEEC